MATRESTTGAEISRSANDESSGETPDSYLLPQDSERTPTLSVVMPTLNEEDGIAECIERVKAALADLQVYGEVVVSDSSTDRTPEIARERGAIVVSPDEPGYGYAYQYAFARTRGRYIAMGDADTTYDFEELPKLFELVRSGDADMAMGSRLEGEIESGAMPPLHRYVGNPLLTKFLNVFYQAGVTDAHSGMRVFSRDAYEEMNLGTDGMEFASEMIMEAGARGLTIAEEPITYHERAGEATLESFRDGWRHVRFMLVNAPGYLFSVPGAALAVVGTAVMFFGLLDVSFGGTSFGIHSLVGGSLMTLLGTQVSAFGVFAALAGDPIRRPRDPVTEFVLDHVQLEHGASFGFALFAAGLVFVTAMVSRWVTNDFARLPFVEGNVLALTAVVLGLQITFQSFFLSAIEN